jgi:photosystem II stability/assembly factor-like uncharacterized protein
MTVSGFIAGSLDTVASPDGAAWVCLETEPSTTLSVAANSTFAIGTDGNHIYRSINGINWIQQTLPTLPGASPILAALSCNNTICVCAGWDGITNAVFVLTSADGVTWIVQTVPTAKAVPCTTLANAFTLSVSVGPSLHIIGCNDGSNHAQILSSPDGITWTARTPASASTTSIFAVSQNSTKFFLAGTNASNNTVIQTSSDAITWASQTPADSATEFFGIYATDSLIVAVGFNVGGDSPLINTSTDGVTWFSRTVTGSGIAPGYYISPEYLVGVAKGSSLWVAAGASSSTGTIVTSSDGVIWTTAADGFIAPLYSAASFNVVIPEFTNAVAFIYDDCCHLWTSFDQGATWLESHHNEVTNNDTWTDAQIAQNDRDFQSRLCFDPGTAAIGGGNTGIIATSTDFGFTGSWDIINPYPSHNSYSDNNNNVVWQSGAISTIGNIVLLTPSYYGKQSGVTTLWPLFISTDGGLTANPISGLSNRYWLTCCMSRGGIIQYAASHANHIIKSIDSGTTWTTLTSSPISTQNSFINGNQERLRCSESGSVVIYGSSANAAIYVSTNAGATWATSLALSSPNVADVGLSSDGRVMVAVDGATSNLYLSTNTGTSWSTLQPGSGALFHANTCNVSPDGTAIVVGDSSMQAAISFDAGATWVISQVPAVFAFVASYVVPAVPIPPPPVPPAKGGYIIERLDNRIWPTVENCWCVDCGFTLQQPKPPADLTISAI